MSILDNATITFETSNPVLSEFINDANLSDKIPVYEVCNYLGIDDNNFGGMEAVDKIQKIIRLVGNENLLEKIQSLVSEIGFKPNVLDEIYSRLRIDDEILRTTKNLDNLLKQKYNTYGNTSNIQRQGISQV